jgi:hypothetical protein
VVGTGSCCEFALGGEFGVSDLDGPFVAVLGGEEDEEAVVATGGAEREGTLGGLSDWDDGDWPSGSIWGGEVD